MKRQQINASWPQAPVQKARTNRAIQEGMNQSPSIARILRDPHFWWCCMSPMSQAQAQSDLTLIPRLSHPLHSVLVRLNSNQYEQNSEQ